MSRVSSSPLKKKFLNKISDRLIREIVSLKTERESNDFLKAFLTENEKIMLAKRLMMIYMLARGHSFGIITKTLHFHRPTVGRYWRRMKNGELESVIRHIKKEFSRIAKPRGQKSNFWLKLETMFEIAYTPYHGPRWKEFFEGLKKMEEIKRKR